MTPASGGWEKRVPSNRVTAPEMVACEPPLA